jgi:hypothetical protein
MKTKWLLIGSLGILLLIGGSIFAQQNGYFSGANAYTNRNGIAHQSMLKSTGVPAIEINGKNKIDKSDIEVYLKDHTFVGGPTVSGATPEVTSVEFITAKEASQRLKDLSIGLDDNAQVCYVEWAGPFNLAYASAPPHATPLPPAAIGVELFDAESGNLLLWWVPNE